jgi:multidrug transporter EmrE-like cation transporter
MKYPIVLVLLASLNSTLGNLMLKQSRLVQDGSDPAPVSQFLSAWFIGAVFFYVVNVFLFAKALDRMPVSLGYPILAASGFAMLTIAAAVLFGERLGVWQIAGLILVTIGIACLARGI